MIRAKRLGLERILIATVGLVVMGGAVQAQAAPPGAVNSPAPTGPDPETPQPQAIGHYEAKGVPVGSFRLFPDLELDEVYNDNIFATANTASPTASFIQMIKPTLDLRSNW